jgi:hypothetical protein
MLLQTAPVLLFYPPTTGPNAKANSEPIRYEFMQGAPVAEQPYEWIKRQLPGVEMPPLSRPFNYLRAVTISTLLLGGISFFTLAGPYVLPLVQNRNLWAAISLIIILLFTSGHMFNHIRKVPYVSGDGKGGIAYFAGGFQNQFGMETQIVAAMCKYYSLHRSLNVLILRRWRFVIRNDCFGDASPTDSRSKIATSGCCHLGMRYVWHVQLLAERIQDQERRISV